MPGYQVKNERIRIRGAADLTIRSLLDHQQYADPEGAAAAVGISSASWPLFGLVWPSGCQLAAHMATRAIRPQERILEIGCGLALASIVCHRRGARVTASDCHPLARAFLIENLRLNALPPMPYCHGDWAASAAPAVDSAHGDRLRGRFELIIGSDVLYEPDGAGLLPQFIDRYATPVGEVLIVDPRRSNRGPFHRRMAALGYALEVTAIEDPLDPGGLYRGQLLHYRRA